MLALFRIVEICGGSIIVDNVDISTISLSELRSSLSIIPQDPVLFSGTVRFNLDPFNEYTDSQIWLALEKSHLKPAIQKLQLKLEAPVAENGENFSVGQRCMICMARAMLQNSSILIMDEATASVDMETDSWIQQSLRENFPNCTLLTIAHRLNTIIDYDRVIVMDNGIISEFDTPAVLLRNPNSLLTSLVLGTGQENSQLLIQLAFKHEQEKNNNHNNNNNNFLYLDRRDSGSSVNNSVVQFHSSEENDLQFLFPPPNNDYMNNVNNNNISHSLSPNCASPNSSM
jgi:ABC-type multidrug transport system ATPase subunit